MTGSQVTVGEVVRRIAPVMDVYAETFPDGAEPDELSALIGLLLAVPGVEESQRMGVVFNALSFAKEVPELVAQYHPPEQ